MLEDCEDRNSNVTAIQMVDMLRGKTVKSYQIKGEIQDKYKGRMKILSERDIRRIIIGMLKKRLLKESFVQMKVRGQMSGTISVYLQPGRYH
jgi:hypothetical protein